MAGTWARASHFFPRGEKEGYASSREGGKLALRAGALLPSPMYQRKGVAVKGSPEHTWDLSRTLIPVVTQEAVPDAVLGRN